MFFQEFYKFNSGNKIVRIYNADNSCFFIPFEGTSMSDRVGCWFPEVVKKS